MEVWGMIRLTLALAAALAVAVWIGWGLWQDRRDLRDANTELADQIAQARIAENIARALLVEEQARAADLSSAIAEIYGGTDAPLPDHLRKLLSADGL
jgi:predicted negative regulator of RcsB-dependent stress response